MITKSYIKQMARTSAYTKGKNIYESGRVLDFDVEEEEELDHIEATVKGSGRNSYTVSGSYDVDEEQVVDIACDCPAYAEYDGICKHCVAVLLEYRDWQEERDYYDEDEMPYYDEMSYDVKEFFRNMGISIEEKKPQKAKRPLETTPLFKELLDKKVERKKLPLLEQDIQGKVKVEPHMEIATVNGNMVNFKVGVNQMYVVKDIVKFAEDIEQQRYYVYGKKLEFTHTLEAFRKEDRPLVKWICKWADEYGKVLRQQRYYGYNYNTRNIDFTATYLEEFINLMEDRQILISLGHRGESLWQVTNEKLPRELTIKGDAQGANLQIKYFEGYRCNKQNIYFYDQKIYRESIKELQPIQEFINCMAEIPDRAVYISKEDMPTFCREVLPSLEKFYVCHKEHFNPEDYGVEPVSFKIYLDSPQRDWVTCKAQACYGDKVYNVFDTTKDQGLRDQVREMTVEQLIMSYATSYDEKNELAVVSEEDKIYELLTEGIDKLSDLGEVYISDKLKRMNVRSVPKVSVGVSVEGEWMQLTMTAGEMPQEELVEMLSKYKQKRKFYRLKNGDFIKVSGDEIEILAELRETLQLNDQDLAEGKVELPKYRALYVDSQLKAHPSLKTSKNKAFRELIRNMKTVEDNDFEVPEALEGVLREYQKRGYLWLKTLRHNGFGGILADDMGLGKTLQVITFLLSERLEAKEGTHLKTLIVCPASLVFNWKMEIERFAPDLSVKMATGTVEERKIMLDSLESQDIVITSYDLLRRDVKLYQKMNFSCQIIDEGQYIKNHTTQAAKAVKSIKADFKLALTGTPIENRLSELWSLFDYLMPGFLYSYTRFKEELEQPIAQGKDEAAIKRLQKMIQPFVLRRLKREVLTDLPEKLEENQYVTLSGEQQKLYDANVQKLKLLIEGQSDEDFKQSKIQILSELTKLRQICCDPALLYEDYQDGSAKLELCVEMIQNAIGSGHKILVFSQFTSMLDLLQQRLEKEGISYYLLTGSTPKEKRAEMVEKFNVDETSVFCISLKAGGTGLNLTAADIVIHYDPWWNVAVQNQATDRAHRIGQKNVVSVYKMIAKGTIEENIIKLQEAKKELADQILSGEGMNTGSFTKEELLDLLR